MYEGGAKKVDRKGVGGKAPRRFLEVSACAVASVISVDRCWTSSEIIKQRCRMNNSAKTAASKRSRRALHHMNTIIILA